MTDDGNGALPGNGRALGTICAVLFITFLDTTVVSVTLGAVQSDLQVGVVALQWVVNAYALVFASLMLTAGTLGDRFGRKKVMLGGLAVFAAGSLLGALAPNVGVLIAARAVMGLGAAASEPGTLSVIRHVYPDQRSRAWAVGVWAAVCGLALAFGPVVGGVLVGIGVLLVLAVAFVPESSDPQPGRLDLPGFVLGALALSAGIYAVIGGENAGYTAAWVVVLFVVSGLAVLAFVAVERRSPAPMLDLRYVRQPAFSGPLVVAFALYFGVFSIFFFTALYLQEVVGYSGYRTAVQFVSMAATMIVGSLLTGRWVARVGPRVPMATGCLLAAVGIVASEHYLGHPNPFGDLLVSLGLAGLGFGIAVVPVTSAVLGLVPPERSGMAASATNTSRQLGAVFGTAILGAIVNAHLTSDLAGRLNQLGIPANFQAIVIDAIEKGTVPGGAPASATAAYGPIVQQVINAAYGAFRAGLHVALLGSAVLIAGAALVTLVTVRQDTAEWMVPQPQHG